MRLVVTKLCRACGRCNLSRVRLITILLYQTSLHFTQLGGFSYA
nr:MAG TPA_asm: Protein of unknown function DUF116 [Caudoviricetes sp.]